MTASSQSIESAAAGAMVQLKVEKSINLDIALNSKLLTNVIMLFLMQCINLCEETIWKNLCCCNVEIFRLPYEVNKTDIKHINTCTTGTVPDTRNEIYFAYYLLVLRVDNVECWMAKCIIGKSTFRICALCMHWCALFTFLPFPFLFIFPFMMLSQYFGAVSL